MDVLLLDGVSPSALGITLDLASAANRIAGRTMLAPRLLGMADCVSIRGGLHAHTLPIAGKRASPLIVAPGVGAATEDEIDAFCAREDAQAMAAWLQRAARSRRVFASCTGVLLLAMAGLTAHRSCTTTWWLAPAVQARFPTSKIESANMVVNAGGIWTAGASLAHIDLMLALISVEGGAALAQETARRLVFDRRTSQARFIIPGHLATADEVVLKFDAYVRKHLAARLRLDAVAEALGFTPRTLARRLKAAAGLTPKQFLQHVRIDVAQHLLATTGMTQDQAARAIGLVDASSLYRLFKLRTGETPRRRG